MGNPSAMLANDRGRPAALGVLRLTAAVPSDRVPQQRAVVAAHPGAFKLDSQLPQDHAPKNHKATCEGGRWQLRHPRLHRLSRSLLLTWTSSQIVTDDSDTKHPNPFERKTKLAHTFPVCNHKMR
jgi:hypothetical protein